MNIIIIINITPIIIITKTKNHHCACRHNSHLWIFKLYNYSNYHQYQQDKLFCNSEEGERTSRPYLLLNEETINLSVYIVTPAALEPEKRKINIEIKIRMKIKMKIRMKKRMKKRRGIDVKSKMIRRKNKFNVTQE